MNGDNPDRPYSVRPGEHKILRLDPDTVPPIGGFGRLIAPQTLCVSNEELDEFFSSAESDDNQYIRRVYDNSLIFFPLVPDIGGATKVENDDNWGLGAEGVNAETFHQRGIEGQGVRIGIADSGMDSTHSVFRDLLAERRLVSFAHFDKQGKKKVQQQDGSLVPDTEAVTTFGHWHGTHCAGILVGQETDGKTHGVAPRSELVVARVLESANEGTPAGILAGLWWLTTQACDVVSISLGQPGYHEVWWEPISALLEAGVVVVAAVGNEGLSPGSALSRSPGNYLAAQNSSNGRLIPVGAHDQMGTVWDESGGETVDWRNVQISQPDGSTQPSVFASMPPRIVPSLVAPGVNIVSASPPSNKYRSSVGSSMATPHIAGLIALVLSELRTRNANTPPNVAADIVLACLTDISPPGTDTRSGNGRVDNQALSKKLAEIVET